MAETNDRNQHYRSLRPNSLNLLDGQRYHQRYSFEANQTFKIPEEVWDGVKDSFTNFEELVQYYVSEHYANQAPRILELERYANADNDIHYWNSKKKHRADNRIASPMARYMTDVNVGYTLGNALIYGYENKQNDNDDGENLLNTINDLNSQIDEPYLEKMVYKSAVVTGRAYDLVYLPKGSNYPKVTNIDPQSCFIVYSTDVEPKELFAVRYYLVDVAGDEYYKVEIYTEDAVYYIDAGSYPDDEWQITEQYDNQFDGVPITEYPLNEERVGAFEPSLDSMDAYDKSLSSMANSQEDFSNAMLVIQGQIDNPNKEIAVTDDNGNAIYKDNITHKPTKKNVDGTGKQNKPMTVKPNQIDTKDNVLYLKPSQVQTQNGVQTSPVSASYLTKSLDATEWQTYVNQLLHDIHEYSNTPDMSSIESSGNMSEQAMRYKLWGLDQETNASITLFKRGIRRRLNLLGDYWSKVSSFNVSSNGNVDIPSNVTITFTPNLPQNDQQTAQNIQLLNSTGSFSSDTLRRLAQSITGKTADQEAGDVKNENDDQDERDASKIASVQAKMQPSSSGGDE